MDQVQSPFFRTLLLVSRNWPVRASETWSDETLSDETLSGAIGAETWSD